MNKGYYYEAAGRISVVQDDVFNNLQQHKALKKKKYQKKLEKVQSILGKLYQVMAAKM
jgi:hypothetical protein